jgi:hypothetical protein
MSRKLVLVYQGTQAHVYDITPRRCPRCLDTPGSDGMGRLCRTCRGAKRLPMTAPRRLLSESAGKVEFFVMGARAMGAVVEVRHCADSVDAADVMSAWQDGPGPREKFPRLCAVS